MKRRPLLLPLLGLAWSPASLTLGFRLPSPFVPSRSLSPPTEPSTQTTSTAATREPAAAPAAPAASFRRSASSPSATGALRSTFWDGIVQGVAGATAGSSSSRSKKSNKKCPVLICPAQLSIPADYRPMMAEFKDRGYPAYCADLTRFGWIAGLLPSALSLDYVKGELIPAKTLGFYYEAIDRALEEIKQNHPGERVHVVGHSIGGWIARAWLAEACSSADRDNVVSLTTLGTPNTGLSEEDGGPWAAADQTRGLLKNINARFPGAHVEGVRYTSVAGTALEGKFPGSVEEMLAFVSYLPLAGDGGARGDGIIPREAAVLEGSNVVELPTSKHSGFVPFPGQAIDLGEEFLWYGSPDLMGEWIGNLEEAERKKGVYRKGGGAEATGGSSGGWPW